MDEKIKIAPRLMRQRFRAGCCGERSDFVGHKMNIVITRRGLA